MSPAGVPRAVRRTVSPLRVAFYWTIRTLALPLARAYLRLRVEGRSRVPASGPCLIVANHTSYLDAAVLGASCPRRITFMITEPIYRMARMRWFYYLMGSIPVAPETPDPGALKAALRTLQQGGVLGIFPEGQRMPDGRPGEGKSGASLIAARTGAPVVPALILGAFESRPVGSLLPRPARVRVIFGEPLRFPAGAERRASRTELERFTRQLMAAIVSLKQAPIGDAASGRADVAAGAREDASP
ncbi:MAG TPA: lysophospholipid acyltransferase family protein [Candidatus Polarisedimenticolia bacterium]|nr:lysophospholipid acyltransferase family protein [Candidatus Polarisedimenticolia bacterium]